MAEHKKIVQPLLTDFYQISMAYAYWKSNKTNEKSVFDLYFRRSPFSGEFTIFAGLEDVLTFLEEYHFSNDDIDYIENILGGIHKDFRTFLKNLTANEVSVWAVDEGSVVFPRVPIIRVEGPLVICQLLETTLLNLCNYASLVTTNAARFRLAAGEDKQLLEFGLRRAQGPDGGLSASRFCYIGGFDGTSNVLAGKMFNIPVKGTHAHAYITSFVSPEDLPKGNFFVKDGSREVNFVALCKEWLKKLVPVIDFLEDQAHKGEFTAFVSYALAFPNTFLCLVDTYNVLRSGIPNFCAVALALFDCGYQPLGIRIDSGDLAYISVVVRNRFESIAKEFGLDWFGKLTIVASNDINEDTIHSLNQQKHSIDSFGIGTHLVTCQKQPALGCVYKLVEIESRPTIKLSEDIDKMTIPGKKEVFRLFNNDGLALLDIMQRPGEPAPKPNERVLSRHPYQASMRAYVTPAKVETLYKKVWDNGKRTLPKSLESIRENAKKSLKTLRQDHKRVLNPTPYKVSVSNDLYHFTQDIWMESAPIGEIV